MKSENAVDVARILNRVQRPSRYIGREWNLPSLDFRKGQVRMVMAFPDLYEVGMSHLGLRILYEVVNSTGKYTMERVMAPAPDLEVLLRAENTPLFTLETNEPVANFDVLGFSIQYELSATNILNILNLSNIPLRSENRDHRHPIVLGGGPCVYNPEPFAPFFDVFLIGEGEEAILDFLDLYAEIKPQTDLAHRQLFLEEISKVPGFYVPSLYQMTETGAVVPTGTAPPVIKKRYIKDLNTVKFPTNPLVPHSEIVHDRGVLELFRGCLRGCRFCQAGMIYRPRRDKSLTTLLCDAEEVLRNSGYDELGLLSLSTMDYKEIETLVDRLTEQYSDEGISLSLPSLRMDDFAVELAEKVQRVRKGTLTLAPEAGSARMRNIINKNITADDIINTSTTAYNHGFKALKFYMMIGLPFETQEDIEGIKSLIQDVKTSAGKGLNLNISLGTFVPKAFTPFQWCGQENQASIAAKQRELKDWAKTQKGVRLNYHDFATGFLEAVIARGDRRIGAVLEKVFLLGARLDGWSEYFRNDLWLQAFAECGINPQDYAERSFDLEDALPWDHISCGVTKKFLQREYLKARQAQSTPHCEDNLCSGCGIGCRKEGSLP